MPLICIKRDTNASIQNHCHESWFNNFSIWPIFYSWRVCIIKNGIETIFYAKMNVIRVASSTFFSVALFDRCLLCWKSYLKRIFCTLDQIQFEKSQSIEPIKYCSSTKMEENEFTCESYFVLHRGSANKQMLPSISYLRCFTWKATARIAHICFVSLLVALHHHISGIRNLQLKICWVCDSDICSHSIYLCHCWDTLSSTYNGNGIFTVYSNVASCNLRFTWNARTMRTKKYTYMLISFYLIHKTTFNRIDNDHGNWCACAFSKLTNNSILKRWKSVFLEWFANNNAKIWN